MTSNHSQSLDPTVDNGPSPSSHRSVTLVHFANAGDHPTFINRGAFPIFLPTSAVVTGNGTTYNWLSRQHRKRVLRNRRLAYQKVSQKQRDGDEEESVPLMERTVWSWHPDSVSWHIAYIFFLGSACFCFSTTAAFVPSVSNDNNRYVDFSGMIAFAGSLFFSIGSVLNVVEILLTPDQSEDKSDADIKCWKCSPTLSYPYTATLHRFDFWIAMIQLVGALTFSVNTCTISGEWTVTEWEETVFGLVPGVVGPVCFTISGYLSILEITHSISPFLRNFLRSFISLQWNLTFFNFLGGVGFLVNGVMLFYNSTVGAVGPLIPLLLGSVFFQIGFTLQWLEQCHGWTEGDPANRLQHQTQTISATEQTESVDTQA